MVKKSLIAALLTAVCLTSAFADGNLSMELDINNVILQSRKIESIYTADGTTVIDTEGGDAYLGWLSTGSSAFSFKSSGNRNVKADLAFSFIFPEQTIATEVTMPLISLDKAYVKARFPEFRITAGKTRLGWGEGFVFNSGDVIFGSTDVSVDLTSSEVRSETKWLTALNIPLGRFSFIEGVAVAPESDSTSGYLFGNIENFGAGGRFYTKIIGVKFEGGYYFDNSDGGILHKPYLSLQGNFLTDIYLNASASIPGSGKAFDEFRETLNISAGIFYPLQINSVNSMSFRLEGLYLPFSSWAEEEPADSLPYSDYAVLLYPEIGWVLNDSLSLSIRSIFSPVDLSALFTAGGSWNVFEGFSINGYAIFYAGDEDDLFAWNRSSELWQPGVDLIDGFGATIGINYIY